MRLEKRKKGMFNCCMIFLTASRYHKNKSLNFGLDILFHKKLIVCMILQKALKLLVATCIIYCPSAKAQTTYGSVTISSPTAAALGKYGDIPVNYNTGIPQI